MITIYGKDNCPFCVRAKELAQRYNLTYEYRDLDNPTNIKDFKELFPGVRTVPQIMWHGRHIGGYNDFVIEIENTLGGYGEQRC